jgi:hypothetical protein
MAIWAFTTTVTAAQLGSSTTSISSFTTARHSYTCHLSSKQPLSLLLHLHSSSILSRWDDVELFVDRITEIKFTQFKDNHGISPPPLDDKDQSKLNPKHRISEYSEEPAAKCHSVFSWIPFLRVLLCTCSFHQSEPGFRVGDTFISVSCRCNEIVAVFIRFLKSLRA